MFFRRLIQFLAVCVIALAPVSAQNQNAAALQQKADSGDPIAQFDLARAYMDGKVVKKDPEQGLAWLRKSAGQGYVGAEYALAYMYQIGAEKLPKDQHEAANWFRKAARQQNKASQDRLREMLAQKMISPQEANWRTAEPTASVPSRESRKGKATPFSLADVETGLKGWITSNRMTVLVQKFGVDFTLSSATRQRLKDEGANDNLLQTISTSKRAL